MAPSDHTVSHSGAPPPSSFEGTIEGPTPPKQQQEVFHFVSVNPTSDVQKSHNRTVIRSHASKYIWRQHRAGRPDKSTSKKACTRDPEAPVNPPSIRRSKPAARKESWCPPNPASGLKNSQSKSSSDRSAGESDDAGPKKAPPRRTRPTAVATPSRTVALRRQNDNPLYISPANIATTAISENVEGPFLQLRAWLADPGHVYPSMLGESSISKLMRYAVSELWPGLVLGASNQKWDREDAAENWLPRAMSSPPLFTAFLYGAAGHMQTRKRLEGGQFTPQTREEKLEQIICETETVKSLNKMMANPSQACSDEIILAVLCMAFNRIDYSGWSVSDPWPKAPLRNLQWLDVYGGLSLNDHHIKGLLALIEMRGGLSELKMPGLAETLSTSGIMLATKYLVAPRLPFVPIFKESADGQTPRWPSIMNFATLDVSDGTRPDPFHRAGLSSELVDVLHNMQDYNNVINVYSQGLLPELELAVIADRRNWIQYNLISLPSVYDMQEQVYDLHKTYEVCRLAALVYSMMVIFPLPAANRPFKRLAAMVKAALIESEPWSVWSESKETLLWSLVMGGMAAKGAADRDWFVEQLRDVLTSIQVETWEALKDFLRPIMWMDSVCDMGGQALWAECVNADTINDD